jgi:hypothetical protein
MPDGLATGNLDTRWVISKAIGRGIGCAVSEGAIYDPQL